MNGLPLRGINARGWAMPTVDLPRPLRRSLVFYAARAAGVKTDGVWCRGGRRLHRVCACPAAADFALTGGSNPLGFREAGRSEAPAGRFAAPRSHSHPAKRFPMHEFQVLATFAVAAAIYFFLFLAAEKFWMK